MTERFMDENKMRRQKHSWAALIHQRKPTGQSNKEPRLNAGREGALPSIRRMGKQRNGKKQTDGKREKRDGVTAALPATAHVHVRAFAAAFLSHEEHTHTQSVSFKGVFECRRLLSPSAVVRKPLNSQTSR